MGEKNIIVSFLIPTLGEREAELRRLFESLKKQVVSEGFCTEDDRDLFSCFEAVVIPQDNYNSVRQIVKEYESYLNVVVVESKEKGLSKARNKGLPVCKGEIVVLSDDDCYYSESALECVISEMKDADVLLTQIRDSDSDALYKKYSSEKEFISSKYKLLSRSSIEIAFRKAVVDVVFDEQFGVGARFVAGEENDFLLNAYKMGAKIKYVPKVTVYHPQKARGYSAKSREARGAFYAKHFNFMIAVMICMRDLLIRRQNIFKDFFRGYNEYRKGNN